MTGMPSTFLLPLPLFWAFSGAMGIEGFVTNNQLVT